MKAHFFQHVPFEGLGSMGPMLVEAGYTIGCTRFHASDPLPDPYSFDLLVIMGGPMSVNDENEFPWLREAKRFVRTAIETGKPVLGICLGAQLIASAMGARVYPNIEKEIGWFPISAAAAPTSGSFRFPAAAEVFHWHGETFDLPAGAIRLAESEGCKNQAFQLGDRVLGLQFHLETTPESARDLVNHCRSELQPSRYVQDEERILAAGPEKYRAIHQLMSEVLSYLGVTAT